MGTGRALGFREQQQFGQRFGDRALDRPGCADSRPAILSTASTGFFLVYNTRVATVDFFDPHEVERCTVSRALLFKFNYLFDF